MFIKESNREHLTDEELKTPIGKKAVIHTHNTFPSVSQALNCPMWKVPDVYSDFEKNNKQFLIDKQIEVNRGFNNQYRETKAKYIEFANSLIERVRKLN